MTAWRLSPAVGNTKNDSPELHVQVRAQEEPGDLFSSVNASPALEEISRTEISEYPRERRSSTRVDSPPPTLIIAAVRGTEVRSKSPIRGDVKKKLSSFLSEGRRMVACIQPNLSSGEAVGSPRIPDRPGSWLCVFDGFMRPWSFDAFGSGSYASKRVG
jgi:hypothetical protein